MSTDGRLFLVYTTKQGGFFSIPCPVTMTEFEQIKEQRLIDVTPRDRDGGERDFVTPVFIMLMEVRDNHDFILGCSRDDAEGIKRYSEKYAQHP